jgi:hypothetical protein
VAGGGVTSYSVVWEDGRPLEAGRLELAPEGIMLHGPTRDLAVSFSEIENVRVAREPAERIGGKPALVLLRSGSTLLRIGSLDGLGTLNELAATLAVRTA